MKQAAHPIEQEELMAYLDGELDPERASSVAAHVAQCADCRSLSADLRGVAQHMTAWEVESVPARLTGQALRRTLEQRSAVGKSLRKHAGVWSGIFSHRALWASAAVLVCLVLLYETVGVNLLRSPKDTSNYSRLGVATKQMQPELFADAERQIPENGRSTVARGAASRTLSDLEPGSVSVTMGPMIAQTASLSVETQTYDQSRSAIERIVAQHQGYVDKLNARALADLPREIDATVRIPSDQLESALADFKTLGHVAQESRSNEDVSTQYVDVAARLKSARTTEQRLLELLAGHTGKLQDVLAVEQELERVRGEIESTEGQRALLAHRVRYSAVELSLREEYRERLSSSSSRTRIKLWNALVGGYRNLAGGVLAVALFSLSYGPALLLWFAVLFFPVRFAWRRWRASSPQASSLGVK